jgi:hypothetical protein
MLTVFFVLSTMIPPAGAGSHTIETSSLPSSEGWLSAGLSRQDEKSRGRKGDSVTLRGCLAGASLDATDAEEPEVQTALIGGLTFQLKGDKKLLKSLRDKHDGKVVTVRGVLKSDLVQAEGQSRTVGRTRITIGGAMPNPNSPQADTRRALPVLEVKSFDGTGETPCR